MYLWNTKDLYVCWWELCDWNIFLKDNRIFDDNDTDILEDNEDMLPAKVIYDWKEYILNIRSWELQSWHSIYSLQYQWMKYLKWTKIQAQHNFYENDWESINELIRKFNEHKKETGYPQEIRYIYN